MKTNKLFFFIVCALISFEVKGDDPPAVKALKQFVGDRKPPKQTILPKPEKSPIAPPKEIPKPKPKEIPEYRRPKPDIPKVEPVPEPSAVKALRKFANYPKVPPVPKAKTESKLKIPNYHVDLSEMDFSEKTKNFPIRIGHTPETLHSVSLIRAHEATYAEIRLQFFSGQYNKIKLANNWLKEVNILDPIVEIGGIANITENQNAFTAGIKTALVLSNSNGIAFKAHIISHDYKDLLENTNGRILSYYYHSKVSLLKKFDFWTFYLGWYSKPLKLNFSNLDEFTSQFKGLIKQSESIIAGVHYMPDVGSSLSFGFEYGLNNFSVSTYYKVQ